MNHKTRTLILLTVCLFLVLPITLISFAQSNDYIFFSQTQHFVRGEFLEKYNSVSDPVRVFGYPITEEVWAPGDSPFAGKRVQYFQRAVFEWHMENAPGHRVQLVPLGAELVSLAQFSRFESLPPNHPACETFPGSDFQVCYAFLQFFNEKGSVAVFGIPLTDLVIENNRIIQYFEYARFEWRPEMAPGQRVFLSNLGELYFNNYENPDLKAIPDLDASIQEVQSLQVRAFPLHAVTSNKGNQTIYVVVKDQLNRPVPGAVVRLKIILPDQQAYSLDMTPTNENGLTYVTFAQQGELVGRVHIAVEVAFSQFEKTSLLSYRIW
jgi:hypothetical protein